MIFVFVFVFLFVCFCCFCLLLFFLRGDSHQRKAAPETTKFCLIVVCCVSYATRLKASLISKNWKEPLITLIFVWKGNI